MSMIKRGDLVVVERGCDCTINDPDIGILFVVSAVVATRGFCDKCNKPMSANFAMGMPGRDPSKSVGIPIQYLRKIEPPSQFRYWLNRTAALVP